MIRPSHAFLRLLGVVLLLSGLQLSADTLVFTNGDRLSGSLVRADATMVVFNSPMFGQASVPWQHIRSLTTLKPYVLITTSYGVHQGRIRLHDQQLIVQSHGHPTAVLTPKQAAMLISPDTYARDVTAAYPVWSGWKGSLTTGLTLLNATQSVRSFTGSIQLSRATPRLDWLPPQSKTAFAFEGNYGRIAQTGHPTVLTDILNADLEQDEYLSPRLFSFGDVKMNRNLAQGLGLQQAYGGGVGLKLKRTAATQLSVRADLHYTNQRFLHKAGNGFLASSYSETLRHRFDRAVIWTESFSVTPSLTQRLAYQTAGSSSLAIPLYRALSFNTSLIDSYINNPLPGFQKNSLQFITGLQFTLH